MAAGQGFKTFTTGEVLTAGDVNGYLMQGINVFATTTARDAAITAPAEGQFAFTKDTNGLWYYDGAAWVASGATGDIEGVTAGVGISGGGTSGTVTITNDMATTITASGDIVVGTGSGTYDNLPIGTTGQVLTADTTVSPYKVKWAAAGGGDNGPSFSAYLGTNQSITNGTFTKVQANTEGWDTNSAYNTSTYEFTPQTAGYYVVSINGFVNLGSPDDAGIFALYKNGAASRRIVGVTKPVGGNEIYFSGSAQIYLNGSSDYISLYAYWYNASRTITSGETNFQFSATLIRTA